MSNCCTHSLLYSKFPNIRATSSINKKKEQLLTTKDILGMPILDSGEEANRLWEIHNGNIKKHKRS